MTKFKVNDQVKIISDKFADYGRYLGATGTISFVGIKRKKQRVYHFMLSKGICSIDVGENDLELICSIDVGENDLN